MQKPEQCPFTIGSRVQVRRDNAFASDWPDVYSVVMVEWRYQEGIGDRINIAIASDDEIKGRCGWTDGWSPDDLSAVAPQHHT